jgi:hypothetical protein
MARRDAPRIEFDALAIEGGILPPEWLGRVAALDAAAQTPADYGIKKGLQLRDEITRNWRIAEALWAEFASARAQKTHDVAAVTHAFVRQFLTDVLGFDDLAPAGGREIAARRFPISFEGLGRRVPVVVGLASERLDESATRHGDGVRRRSAWGALQEYLNASDDVLWGIASNGYRIRLGRDNASLTRPAWLEADLERIFSEQRFADFSVLWLTLHASRFGRPDQRAEDAPLEVWRAQARERGSRARTQLRTGFEAALRELGQGFVSHPGNAELRAQLAAGTLAPQEYFNELLRLAYRVIFLLTLEEREILHPQEASEEARRLYADGYGVRRLRERAVRRAGHDRHADLWTSLRPVWTALGSASGEPMLGLRGLGGLFARDQCPHLEGAEIENRTLLTALFRLAWIREGEALARVNWRDMGPEELGSVYESLLELVPLVSDQGRRFTFAGADESAGNARKLSGSYYTPDELVQALLDSALEPVVTARLAAQPDAPDQALLSVSVIDPACGSGHFLLAAARRLATHLARARSGGTPGADEYQRALRDVVTHCIHGVDRNPMALELARMALWLEAYTPDRALGFLDHHLVCGDALLGLLDLGRLTHGIPDEALKPLAGDDREITKALGKLNRSSRKALEKRGGQESLALGSRTLADAFEELEALDDGAVESVEAKGTRYAQLRADAERSSAALGADLFVGAFLMRKRATDGELLLTEQAIHARFPTTGTLIAALEGTLPETHSVARAARSACRDAQVLHWPIAFPQIFARGGFDVVLGNPPWERPKPEAAKFFSHFRPEIANAPNAARRASLMEELEEQDPRLFADWRKHEDAVLRLVAFLTDSGRYPLTAVGKFNLGNLFVESARQMLREHGRAGMLNVSGLATDDSGKAFISDVMQRRVLVSFFDFENRRGLFPEVHSSYKFSAITISGSPLTYEAPDFVFFAHEIKDLAEEERHVILTDDDISLLNPLSRTCPVFRTRRQADLTKAIYRRAKLRTPPAEMLYDWDAEPTFLFVMSDHSELFQTREELGLRFPGDLGTIESVRPRGFLPLYESKMFHQYNHRWSSLDSEGGQIDISASAQVRSDVVVVPRYWMRSGDAQAKLGALPHDWLIAVREVTNATNERTVIAGVLPKCPVGHNAQVFRFNHAAPEAGFFLAILNSFVFDFAARTKVGGSHLSSFILRQLPVLPAKDAARPLPWGDTKETVGEWCLRRVLELTYTAEDLRPFALACGHDGPAYPWNDERRRTLRAELDAAMFLLYGVRRRDIEFVMSHFPIVREKDEKAFGYFRTRDEIISVYDQLAEAEGGKGLNAADAV